jgi:hypothetical protein
MRHQIIWGHDIEHIAHVGLDGRTGRQFVSALGERTHKGQNGGCVLIQAHLLALV